MSRKKKVLIAIAVLLVGAAVVAANVYFRKDKGLPVTTEAIRARDLEAVVSASGKIQPKRLVNISADTPGRVVDLAVNEGDRIKKGQFLLQIDPKSLRSRVEGGNASLQAAEASLEFGRPSLLRLMSRMTGASLVRRKLSAGRGPLELVSVAIAPDLVAARLSMRR